jgi:hypothetical protein
MPPRLFKVNVVMLKFCNTALRQSSRIQGQALLRSAPKRL